MVKIIAKDECIREALKRALPIFIGEDKTLVFVVLDQLNAEGVQEVKNTKERPMIFCSFLTEEMLITHDSGEVYSLLPLLAEAQCGFMRLPFELTRVPELHAELVEGKKQANEKLIANLCSQAKERLVSILLHDTERGKSDEARLRALKRAEDELGLTGAEEDVRKQLEDLREEIKSSRSAESTPTESGGVIAGVFCDVEGTLICEDTLIPGRLEMLAEYAKTGPVTLWTGGDTNEIGATLAKLGVSYPLLSKNDFKGKTVEIAIDDRTEDFIAAAYSIQAKQFIQLALDE